MHASREYRRILNALRRFCAKRGQRNGVISAGLLDMPWQDTKLSHAATARVRRKGVLRRKLATRPDVE